MTDEVLIKLGVDASSIKAGLRGVTGMFDELKAKLGGGLGNLLGGLTVAGVGAWTQHMAALAKEIRLNAEVTGTSTQFIQLWAVNAKKAGVDAELAERAIEKLAINIGKAKDKSSESATVFSRYGIALRDANGHAYSTQDVIGQIADRMKDTEDPTIRAAMAVEMFGKGAVHMADALRGGKEALDAFMNSKSYMAFSKGELETAEGLKMTGKAGARLANRAGLIAATALAPWAWARGHFADMDRWGKERGGDEAGAEGPTKEQLEHLSTARQRLENIEFQQRLAGLSHAGKLNLLMQKRAELQAEIRNSVFEELNATEIETVKTQQRIALAELNKSVNTEISTIEKERAKAAEDHHKKILALRKDITSEYDKIVSTEKDMSNASRAPFQSTVAELAASGRWGKAYWTGRPEWQQDWAGQMASRAEWLGNDARAAFRKGNKDWGDADITARNNILDQLAEAGIIAPERSMEKMAESLDQSKIHLAELVKQFEQGTATVSVKEGE